MTSKKERLTDEELLAQFDDVVEATAKTVPKASTSDQHSEADLFEELGIPERPKPASRPHTPHLTSKSTTPALRSSPKRSTTASPPDATRSSEEKLQLRKSGDSSRSFHTSFTPATEAEGEAEPERSVKPEPAPKPAQRSGGGWWGGIISTATAAVKQAEALAKEIQQNEEAQRWAEQVKGNVGALRGLGRLKPLPLTFRSYYLHPLLLHASDKMMNQAVNFAHELSQPLPTYYTLSLLQYRHMSACKSTSPTISSGTLPWTL